MAMVAALLCFSVQAHAADAVKIGMVNDQSGPNKGTGKAMKSGVEAYFKTVNDKGGVHGRTLQLVTVDDRYNPDATVDAVLKLVEQEKILALVGTVGTANGVSILPVVKEFHLPFVAPRSGAAAFRVPLIPEVINLRASHQEEIDRLIDVLIKRGARKVAVFYQNDTFGQEVVENTQKALERQGLAISVKASFERGTTVVDPAVTALSAAKPDAVLVAATYQPAAEFLKVLRARGGRLLAATGSFAGGENLVTAAGPAAEGLVMTQVVPHLADPMPLVGECREALGKYPGDSGLNAVSLEGCLTAKSIVLALKEAGEPPTREGFLKAYEAMRETDLGGIRVSFSSQKHQGQSGVYLVAVQGGTLVPMGEK